MRTTRYGVALVMLLAALMATPWGQAKELEAATTQAGVLAADNTVEKQASGSSDWVACQIGDVLVPGDRIRTGKQSHASLIFVDKTVMRLAESTTIKIVDLTQDDSGKLIRRFEQPNGRSWSDVTPNQAQPTLFEIRGPNAVAAVKGTGFEVDAEDGANTDVRCWRGAVQCQADKDPETHLLDPEHHNLFQARVGKRPFRGHFDPAKVDHFQRWNLDNFQHQQKFLATLPPRIRFHQIAQWHQLRALQAPLHQRELWKGTPRPEHWMRGPGQPGSRPGLTPRPNSPWLHKSPHPGLTPHHQ